MSDQHDPDGWWLSLPKRRRHQIWRWVTAAPPGTQLRWGPPVPVSADQLELVDVSTLRTAEP